jgi:hypothetical protein
MPPYPNLISDSLLINETIQLLRSFGGRASVVKVVDCVMKIPKAEPGLARLLVSDLVGADPRLKLNNDTVELIKNNFERRNFAETNFVVFDLETTGAKTPPCRITFDRKTAPQSHRAVLALGPNEACVQCPRDFITNY